MRRLPPCSTAAPATGNPQAAIEEMSKASTAQDFVTMAAMSDMFEIRTGEMAKPPEALDQRHQVIAGSLKDAKAQAQVQAHREGIAQGIRQEGPAQVEGASGDGPEDRRLRAQDPVTTPPDGFPPAGACCREQSCRGVTSSCSRVS